MPQPSAIAALVLALAAPALSWAAADPIAHGRSIARSYCGGCHAVERTGASPHRGAPPFRELHNRYDVADLQEALAEGILTGHPAMPEIHLWPAEIVDFIAYVKTLERPPPTAGPGS